MTESTADAPVMGSVHDLNEHRTRAGGPVSLLKPAPAENTPNVADGSAQGPDVAVPLWVRSGRAVRAAVTHDRTRTTARLAIRHSSYVLGGGRIVARRAWDGRTAARYERMIRAAEAAGNMEAAAEWEERGRAFRAARHQRRMDLITSPERVARSAAYGTVAGAGGLLLLGIALAIATETPSDVATPALAIVELVRLLVVIVTVVWGPAVAMGPWLVLAGLWAVGRHRQAAPQWALPATSRTTDSEPITPSIVVKALRDLGVPALRGAIKEMGDAGASMLGPIVLAGCGVEVDILLPSGCSTEEVLARRRKLAENLGRHEHEVHLSVAPAARTVRAWIADSGALDEPIGPSPLVLDETTTADYKTGRAPWGFDLRGDAALISLHQRHMLITGLSNQGKTASLRSLVLWLAHDVSVELRIADLKGVGDWQCTEGIATVLVQGPTDDHVIEATEMMEEGVEEMNRRLLAPKGSVFPPLVLICDEAQVAYGSGAIGDDKRPYGGAKATSRYFQAVKAIHDQGRAVNVTTWEGTQDPTNENLPKRSREGNHIRASLVLGTESQARMAIGDAAVDAGAAPHKLRQGLDKGTLVVAGDGVKLAPGQPAITIRTHYISDDDADVIADRIRARRAGVTTRTATVAPVETDHLADIAGVIGDDTRVLTQDVLKRLAVLDETTYGGWSFIDLKRALDGTGAEPYKSDGRMAIARDRIRQALSARDDDSGSASAS
ncbi:ATP-binding protein [Streptomyces sp. NPDC047315]|uniref:ATP-binding protein n=1 Tax=Streptomyces sp. NPDC047315 TaxID=3155142 RepID=UPI003410C489